MKEETITLRVDSKLKKDFQSICELEKTDMSDKIHEFINEEVKIKKRDYVGNVEELFKLFGYSNIFVITKPHAVILNGEIVDDDSEGHFFTVSEIKFSENYTFIDFLNKNKENKIYLYLIGSNLPNEIRFFTI